MVFYDDLGFATGYEVDSDIEYPGDGNWRMPVVRVGARRSLPSAGALAVIRPAGGDPWVLSASMAGVGELYATADPTVLCLAVQFEDVYLIDVLDPADSAGLELRPVRVGASVDFGLVLVADYTRVYAIDGTRVVWRSEDLVTDDLKIQRSNRDRIPFRGVGENYESEVTGWLDSATGRATRN